MDYRKVIAKLETVYPGKTIIKLPEQNPTEILCELDPTELHPEYSVAISVIDKSVPHHHEITTEIYEVLEGDLSVFVDGSEHKLKKDETIVLSPVSVHYAVGNETWIKCTARPGWIVKDHILDTRESREERLKQFLDDAKEGLNFAINNFANSKSQSKDLLPILLKDIEGYSLKEGLEKLREHLDKYKRANLMDSGSVNYDSIWDRDVHVRGEATTLSNILEDLDDLAWKLIKEEF